MRKKPAVSVCVPVYNTEKYLVECLESLINQTLKSIEIICVDDGSTDRSPEILDEYAKRYKNIKVIHQENQGLGGARDAGLEKSTGEYIGFLDADDTVDVKMYEELYMLAKEKKAEIAFCNLRLCSTRETTKKVWYNPYRGELTGEFLHRNTQPTNKIFARTLFERTNARFRKNDSICILLMIKANGLVSCDKKFYHYRIGHESMSTVFKLKNFTNSVESVIEICNQLRQDTKIDDNLELYFDFIIINNIIQTLVVSVMQNKRKIYNKHRQMIRRYSYKKNPYCKKLLKPELGAMKYFASMHILPNSFYVSRILVNIAMRGKNVK